MYTHTTLYRLPPPSVYTAVFAYFFGAGTTALFSVRSTTSFSATKCTALRETTSPCPQSNPVCLAYSTCPPRHAAAALKRGRYFDAGFTGRLPGVPFCHGFQYGCSQVVSPVVGLCQYGAPEPSSTCSSHPGGSALLMAGSGGSAGGLAAAHVTSESRSMPAAPPASASGCSQVVSPVLSLYQYFCGARGGGDGQRVSCF